MSSTISKLWVHRWFGIPYWLVVIWVPSLGCASWVVMHLHHAPHLAPPRAARAPLSWFAVHSLTDACIH